MPAVPLNRRHPTMAWSGGKKGWGSRDRAVLYCTALQCTIMYCNALYYTVLDCTVTCAGIAAARSCGRWCASSKTTRGLPGAASTCCPGPRTTRLWATCSASCSLRITTGWVLVKAEWCQLSGFVLCFPVQADLAYADEHFCVSCSIEYVSAVP